jgi:hypothetical protein
MSSHEIKTEKVSFTRFYHEHYLAEHRHAYNIGLHVFGTCLGLVFLFVCCFYLPWYCIAAFPVVHAVPGLIGHRLFERNAAVGDVRVLRKDFSGLWFIAANHLLSYRLLVAGIKKRTGIN